MKFSPQHSARKLSLFRSNQKNNARFLDFFAFFVADEITTENLVQHTNIGRHGGIDADL